MSVRTTSAMIEMRLPSDGMELMFVRTDRGKHPRHEHWEAVREVGPGRSHRFQVWTDDGRRSWHGQMQARRTTHPGPLVSVQGHPTMRSCIEALREAYRARYRGR